MNTIDGPTKLVRGDAILGGLSMGSLRLFSTSFSRTRTTYNCNYSVIPGKLENMTSYARVGIHPMATIGDPPVDSNAARM